MTADRPQSILGHLEELRWRVLKSLVAIIVGGIVAFLFAGDLRSILEAPFHRAAPESTLQTFAVAEQWGVLMRIGLFGGVVLASPVVLYQLWAFVNPALTERERRWAVPIVAALVVLFVGGVVFGYWTLPRGLEFLLGLLPDVENDLRMADYYSFTLRFLFAFGLAFLYPVFLFAAAAVGLVSSAQLGRWRRWALLLVVIGAALITPTGDLFTLLALSVPLYVMYEATYWLVRLVLRR
ncbi:MAG: twin-arginine translocase subunit TatC [Actinobacteria bacterium]|nr:twin-arginine translocase subunit TatC [Actinomycetota bacterium]MCI0543586.1 twin-arginine translocase subunit TatC [Actinomycetota bacterium]MCI0677937.1 twin-arginine translocase subunit TatC [Actinomycetota bacterium]